MDNSFINKNNQPQEKYNKCLEECNQDQEDNNEFLEDDEYFYDKYRLIYRNNNINNRKVLRNKQLEIIKSNTNISSSNIYITGCTMNCSKHLKKIYKIILEIGKLFNDYKIIFSYDKSNDNTIDLLRSFEKENNKIIILENRNEMSEIRTENISNARNLILNKIREINDDSYSYFIMMDMDDVCNKRFNINVLIKYILNSTNWDALSFNRSGYYDVWALSYDPYMFSCWHYYKKHEDNRNFLKNIVRPYFESKLNKLNNNELYDVYSAFGGFCIYKTNKFINSYYNWDINKNLELIPKELMEKNIIKCDFVEPYMFNNKVDKIFDCEHRHFHLYAKKYFDVQIKVSPYPLFGD